MDSEEIIYDVRETLRDIVADESVSMETRRAARHGIRMCDDLLGDTNER